MQQVPTATSMMFIFFVILIGAGLALALALALVAFRQACRRQEWDHAERLKALELGRPFTPRGSDWARALICVAIGAVVPSVALIVVAAYKLRQPGASDGVWLAPCLIGVPAVVFASRLAHQLFGGDRGAHAGPSPSAIAAAGKEAFDPDSIDVVGSRG